MKKIVLTLLIINVMNTSFGQISTATMLEKVKSLHPNNRISATMDSKSFQDKAFEKGVWVTYYRRGYTVISKTEYPGITHKYTGSLLYKKIGNDYIYQTNMVGDGVYLGVPKPDKNEILKLLNSDLKKLLGNYLYSQAVGDVSKIELVKEDQWKWKKLTMLELKAKVKVTTKISAYKTETAEHIFNITLYSDTYKSPWNKWISTHSEGEKKSLGIKEYTYEELNGIKTLAELDIEKQASEKVSGMRKLNIPVFNTDQELFGLTQRTLMASDLETVKAYLYQVMSKQCKEQGSDVVLNYQTQQWFDKITTNLETYRKTHYAKPKVAHYQTGSITFFDKENRRKTVFEAVQENGTWKIFSIRYYPASASDVSRMEKM